MAKRKKTFAEDSPEEKERLKKIYAESRKNFSAADLQKFTMIEKDVLLEDVIREMEEIQRKFNQKKKG